MSNLYEGLIKVRDREAFVEFFAVYNFRGRKHKGESLEKSASYRYLNESEEIDIDQTKLLLAHNTETDYFVSNEEYQAMIDRKNIVADKRII